MNKIYVKVKSLRNQEFIADKCFVAESYFDRLIGLIGKSCLKVGQGVLFPKCQSVHTWFMSIPIDIVFLSKKKRGGGEALQIVTSVHSRVKPWKLLPLFDLRAHDVLELPAGSVERHKIKDSDELCISSW